MLRNDCITDIETMVQTLSTIKGYTEHDIVDCMAHIVQEKCKGKQADIFKHTKIKAPKKTIEVPDEAEKLAKLFETLYTARRKPKAPIDLAEGARLLTRFNQHVSWVDIEWAIKYSQDPNNCSDKYMPVVQCIPSLIEKYEKLVNHKKRNENFKMNQSFNSNLKEHEKYKVECKQARVVVYYSEYTCKFEMYSEIKNKCPFHPNVDYERFRNMTDEQKKKYFNIMSEEEKELQRAKINNTIKEMKEKLV